MTDDAGYDHCWLPPSRFAPLGRRRVAVVLDGAAGTGSEPPPGGAGHGGAHGPGPEPPPGAAGHGGAGGRRPLPPPGDPVLATVVAEVEAAVAAWGGSLSGVVTASTEVVLGTPGALGAAAPTPSPSGDGFTVATDGAGRTVVTGTGRGLLYGLYHLVLQGEDGFGRRDGFGVGEPVVPLRMLDHWDNLTDGPMGVVERGYAGASLFHADGEVRADLSRVVAYARLLASVGINAVGLNNVNVHRVEATLLTTRLPDVARLAEVFRRYGITVFLSVDFAGPITLGGLDSADPADPVVRRWWGDVTDAVYRTIPDFGGYVVKADSEGRPGPFAYGRDHAEGANLLARALAPHGGTVLWRAFVYDHRQDWRDRSTDRARAAHDHFVPLDGRFDDNVVVQVKHGPLDFQIREPVSPLLGAVPATRLAVEVQLTQEYTGQQRHVCHLAPMWRSVLDFDFAGDSVADIVAGRTGRPAGAGAVVGVSNVGTDRFWTGHPLAQANLHAFGRLAWDPGADPDELLVEWARSTYGDDPAVVAAVTGIVGRSAEVFESYVAPLGVCFMVQPGHHYGPSPDGYEYSAWGTYHFADRDGVGVDRSRASGTGFTGQYPAPWRDLYESPGTCPDELLLFFHHVAYDHRLHSGTTVIQHIYDTHFAGVEEVAAMAERWRALRGLLPDPVHGRVTERLGEQLRSARDWRDTINTYFFRHSGIPDDRGRPIF